MSGIPSIKMNNKPKKSAASKIPTSGRDSGTHSRSSSVSNLTSASDLHSETGDATSDTSADFKIDDRVWVNGTKPGCVKFIGKTEFAPGIWAGVLLDEPVGKNDGSVAGVKYFTCEPMKGIFARPGKLSRTSGAVSSIGDSPMVGVTPKACNIVRASSRTSVCSNMSTPGPRYSSSYRLKVGDRVTVSSLNGLKLGTLRFLGEADFAKGEWAGVELDEPTGKNDGSVAGKRYFTCEMKYGLFAPLHKVSRPGASPVSRPGSVRGTPLCRSNSRDSLNSSVSNSSRASRIRLGITSLTSAQKSKASGMGVTSATKAFEEAIKEKELHIEQLLKERELDRAEFARLANHFEQIESKSSELEKKQKILESEKKTVNEQLTTLQKKHEDTQFQLEEEKIAKTDFEMQLQQRSQILKRINEFISKETEGKFLNIKEILSGQEVLSEINQIASVGDSSASGEFQTKIGELENLIQSLSLEKKELQNKVTELQKCSGEHSTKFESEIISLKTVVQEKDDMITNLKSELNNNIEKVTQLIEDNKYLNEQMLLKEEQAKGHADYVIKELGEKINSLNEQLKMQSSQLAEQVTSVEEKDNKIKTLEQSLNDQGAALLQLQNENKNVSDALKLKEITHEENMSSLKGLEGTIAALKVQLETVNDESQKKINLLEEEIKNKSGLLENYLSSMEEKENLITSLQKNFDSQAAAILQLQNEKKDLNDFLKQRESELNEKAAKQKLLEEQLCALTFQSESSTVENEEKMLDLVKKIEQLTNCLQEKDELLLKNQSELSSSQNAVEELKETVQQLSDKLQQANLLLTTSNVDAAETLSNLKDQLNASAQEKDDLKSDYAKEIAVLKTTIKVQEDELQAKIDIVGQHESQIVLLTEKLKKMDDENVGLKMEIETLSEKNRESIKDKEQLEMAFKAKDEDLVDLVKQLENAKKDLEKNSLELEQNSKQLQILQDTLNLKEEENNQLTSKLQLAEQNVEMLNKDSSDHVMALQTELSKLKEESISAKTHIEQELSKVRNEKEKVLKDLKEKEDSLLEKEENLSSLEKKLTEKDSEISDLLTLKTNLSQTVSKYNSDIEEAKKSEEQISKTLSECEAKLSEKEQELITLKNDVGKLSDTISEKDKALLEKEEFASSLQNKLTDRETEISNLSAQNADLLSNISKFSVDIEESQRIFNEKLANSTAELDNKLKEKDEVIQDIQNQLQKSSEILENKTKELNNKEGELNVLKNIVKEKDAQFEELGQMIESSQKQLALLKEQNEKNESLLQSKESFINEFKVEQEKQLQLKDQSFKEEALKLQSLITSKDDEINSKQLEVSSLLNEVENKKKLVDALQIELETAKVDKNRISEDKSNIYQELNNRIAEIEEKYSKLLEEKEKIAKEELQTRDAKKNLEKVRDKLLEEKSAQEEVVKDRETKLAALQAEIARMQEAFAQHKQELLEKLDVNKMELQAASELKNELDIQHSVIETLQQNLNNSEMKCKEFEEQVLTLPIITSQKNQLQAQIDEFQKISQEKSEMVTKVQEKNLALEEQLNNNKNLILQKEKELSGLKEQLKKASVGKSLPDNSSLKFLEEENLALKNQITFLELKNSENSDKASNILRKEVSPEEEEDRECLLSQVDFLNSIIVDLKQKNEELTRQLEAQMSCWEENDVNLNETSKAIAPRLFCDICDMFDLHDTGDCPKQESCIDEKVPQLRLAGTRQIEERPYCNNCEMFGHWTLDCDEPDTF